MSAVTATPATTAASSKSRFQDIFQAALKSYQKQTKMDLLAHPLASQLQSCDSTAAILAILRDQVREFEKNSAGDERLTKWLGPTVNVLNAFSATVSGGVSLVSFYLSQCKRRVSHVCFAGFFPGECNLHRHWCLPFSEYHIYSFGVSFSRCTSERLHRASQRVKTFSLSFLDVSDTSLHDWRLIRTSLQLRQCQT